MSGIDFLADTNILLYILEGNQRVQPFVKNTLAVSAVSEIEMLGWYKINNREISIINGLLKNCFIIELLPSIKDIAIKIKQKRKIKLPDSIVAATAIYLDVPLLTADKSITKIRELNSLLVEI